jgi:hypothetical protein
VQIHPFSFYDRGPEYVPDLLWETAGINALLTSPHLHAAGQGVPFEFWDCPGAFEREHEIQTPCNLLCRIGLFDQPRRRKAEF